LAMLSQKDSQRPKRYDLWRHSLRTGFLAQRFIRNAREEDPHEMFVAGMLHDLGKLLMLELDEPRYLPLLNAHYHADPALLQAERTLFSFDHPALSAACLRRWHLPEEICLAIHYHHSAMDPSSPAPNLIPRSANVIGLADSLEHALAQGEECGSITDRLASTAMFKLLNLDAKFLTAVIEAVGEDAEFLCLD